MQFNITFKTIFEYILKKLVLCIQIRFVSTEKTTRIASRASCWKMTLQRSSLKFIINVIQIDTCNTEVNFIFYCLRHL